MKIGLNLLYLLPGVVGGTETYAMGLMESLARLDRRSQYWLFLNQEASPWRMPRRIGWHIAACPVRASLRALRYAWEQWVLPRRAHDLGLDLLHSLGYVQPGRLGCKSVVTIHDLNFHNLGHLMSRTRRATLRYFVTQSAKQADHIITGSHFSKKQIVEVLGVPQEKITVTYYGAKPSRGEAWGCHELESRYGIRKPFILGLSSTSPHKNMANLVRAFALLRERIRGLQLVIAGHPPRQSGELQDTIRRERCAEGVVFTGYVPEPVLSGLYAHAEAFVLPSTYEGFGMPILEAFSHGAPVVCSNAAAIPEVAGDAAAYFEPGDPGAMAEAIAAVVEDQEVRERLVRMGSARVRRFTWDQTAQATLEVYRQVLEGEEVETELLEAV